MDILAIIPARSGSKGVPGKNIRVIDGKPMIAYSIEQALSSKLITRVIVSTDSTKYMEIARLYGAETPFIRPGEFARDESPDIDVFYHALTWLRDHENYIPDLCVHFRPCAPIRNPLVIDDVINKLICSPQLDSIRTITNSVETPYKMWHMSADNVLSPVVDELKECYNMPRQSLPKTYYITGYVDVVRSSIVTEQHSMTGKNIGGYLLNEYYNIDYPEDVDFVETCLKIRNNKQSLLIDVEDILMDDVGAIHHENLKVIKSLIKVGKSIYLRYRREDVSELLKKLGNPTVKAVVKDLIETDYYVSRKAINMNTLKSIGDVGEMVPLDVV